MYSTHLVKSFRFVVCFVVIALIGAVEPAFAQSGIIWTGEYYNNQFLSGDPTLVRQDTAIGFNWGTGSPDASINADNFSVRWTTDTYFEAGTYRFSVVADDKVYLRVDNPAQPQINTFGTPAIGQTVTTDITLVAGIHHIQLDFQELGGNAFVSLSWENLTTPPTDPVIVVPPPSAGSTGAFWIGQYYSNVAFAGQPTLTIAESSPTHYWGAGSPAANVPADNFSAQWTSLQSQYNGRYDITVRADDGVRVYVDGILYIDEWHVSAGDRVYTATVYLSPGQHSFQVDYYEATGNAFLDFSVTPTPIVVAPPAPGFPTSAVGTVRVTPPLRLNVRSEPNPDGFIVDRVRANESFPVLGRNADNSWWQINVNGAVGWVYWRYLSVTNAELVPLISGSTGESLDQPPATGFVATPFTNVNIRSGPGTDNAIIGRVPQRTSVSVVGRNVTNTWWQINYGQITGWVSAEFAPLQVGTVVESIPITA